MLQIKSSAKYLRVFISLLLANGALYAQPVPDSADNLYKIPEIVHNSFNLFDNDQILELSLMFDITSYLEEKPQDEYLDALITYKYNSVDSVRKKIRLRARGNYRYRTCEFPPLRLNFEYTSFGISNLDSLKNVKMVTHCFDNETFQEYIMKEYLIYKLYNIVSEYSFRVRFLEVRYIDTGNRGLHTRQYGFLIEPVNIMEWRINAVELEEVEPTAQDVEQEIMDKLSLFQMMIGNSDWALPLLHNLKVYKEYNSKSVIPVPYDFDYSGFAGTDYSVPRGDLSLETITDRLYVGPCRNEEVFRMRLEDFLNYREAFIDEVKNFKYLDRSVRRELIRYIKSFYKLYKKDILLNRLLEECIEQDK